MPIAFANLFSTGLFGKNFLNNPAAADNSAIFLMVLGAVIIIICSYLLGSINFAIIISGRKFKDDIRTHGSKNAGMTNMMRTYGKRAAALTLVGDALKAIVSCLIGYTLLGALGAHIAGLFCMLGHVFPVFYRFKGGKGVVTAFAAILMCNPLVCLILLVLFIIIVVFTKYISLGSIICMLLYPIVLDRVTKLMTGGAVTSPYIIPAVIMAAIVFIKHWENVKRLLSGTENKFSFKKSGKAPSEEAADEKSEEK